MASELTKEDIFRMFAETDKKFQQTFKEIKETFADTDKKFEQTDRKFRQTDRKINKLSELFTGQWGKVIESLVAPSALSLFKDRGIKVNQSFQRIESQKNGLQMEIDILLTNEQIAVAIEVKTTLKVQDVREFLDKLEKFSVFFPRYKGVKLYGGVAGINIEESADKFAYRQGLFVLTSSGEGMVEILNDLNFEPKNFEQN